MLEEDVILSKVSIIKNCLRTIQKVTEGNPKKLEDLLIQDVFVLNIQRSVQASIDIAQVVISKKDLSLSSSYKDTFYILTKEKIISPALCKKMQNMVGFRNIAVHDYQKLNLDILKTILKKHLPDFEEFYSKILRWMKMKK